MKKTIIVLLSLVTVCQTFAQTRLGIMGVSVDTIKVFDNTDSAIVLNHGTLVGVTPGDNVGVTASAHYAKVGADSGIAITVNFALTGPQAQSYYIDTTVNLTGTILKRQLYNDSIVLDSFKIYDGDSLCPILYRGTPRNYVTHHILTLVAAYFNDKNVGNHKEVWVRYGLDGEDVDNYIAPHDTLLYSSIIPRKTVVVGTTVTKSKTYDGTIDAEVTYEGVIRNLVWFESVQFDVTAGYQDRNVGTGKTVYLYYTLKGEDAANYEAPDVGMVFGGEILPLKLAAEGGEASKVKNYDGTTIAEVTSPAKPVGVLDGEQVYLTTMANYEDSTVGAGKKIFFGYSIYGNNAANYEAPDSMLFCSDGEILPVQDAVNQVTDRSVRLYPCPAHDYVNVKCEDGEHSLRLYSISGQLVMETVFEGSEFTLPLSLDPAPYIIYLDQTPLKISVW